MSPQEQIKRMINRHYKITSISGVESKIDIDLDKEVCWKFCRQVFGLYNINLPEFPHKGLKRIEKNQITIPSIVLFRGAKWHSGIVWPDGLHFIHTNFETPLENEKNRESCHIVRKERLTSWPWNTLIEGYYIYDM